MNVQFEKDSLPALKWTIDLSRLYSQLREVREGRRTVPSQPPDLGLRDTGDHETDEPKLSRALSLIPAPSAPVYAQGTLLPPRTVKLHPLGRQPYPVKMPPLNTVMYRVLASSPQRGAVKDFEFEVPLGLPRFINAATLKAMVGAGRRDALLRKVGERWGVCPDSLRIDLQNRSEVFRIGSVQIFS